MSIAVLLRPSSGEGEKWAIVFSTSSTPKAFLLEQQRIGTTFPHATAFTKQDCNAVLSISFPSRYFSIKASSAETMVSIKASCADCASPTTLLGKVVGDAQTLTTP